MNKRPPLRRQNWLDDIPPGYCTIEHYARLHNMNHNTVRSAVNCCQIPSIKIRGQHYAVPVGAELHIKRRIADD